MVVIIGGVSASRLQIYVYDHYTYIRLLIKALTDHNTTMLM